MPFNVVAGEGSVLVRKSARLGGGEMHHRDISRLGAVEDAF
jgi:hypothetical protein